MAADGDNARAGAPSGPNAEDSGRAGRIEGEDATDSDPAPARREQVGTPTQRRGEKAGGSEAGRRDGGNQAEHRSLTEVHARLFEKQLELLAQSGKRPPRAVARAVAGSRRRQHRRTRPQEQHTSRRGRTGSSRLPANAAANGRASVKRARWQQWQLVCMQVVLQRARDAERRKKERRAQAWADGQGAPGARDESGQQVDGAGSSTANTSRTGPHAPAESAAAERDTQTNNNNKSQ